jgi:F-type H+-transporting ATPase subunit a
MSGTIPTTTLAAETDIEVGHHITRTWFGLTFNVDTIWATFFAGLVVIGLGLWVARGASVKNPTKPQLAWEMIVDYIHREVESTLGRSNRYVIQLATALFTFILVANWFEIIPSGEDPKYLPAPTADVNLTYALALFVIVGVHVYSFRQRGFSGYFKAYAHGPKVLIPLTVIEELVKPFTLALRLFGNIFAGGIMIAIIGLIPYWGFWPFHIGWKLFDMFIGLIQAFIFALLTVIYFGMAGETDDAHGEHDAHGDGAANADTARSADSSESDAPSAQPELSGAR